MSSAGWSDLRARVLSAIVMLVVAGAAVWLGGLWFVALVACVVGLMVWELVRMVAPDAPSAAYQSGGIAAATLAIMPMMPTLLVAPILGATLIVIYMSVRREAFVLIGYSAGVWLAGLGLISLRADAGFGVILWLVSIVVATDIAGYFAGRVIGGPKFWPRVSPKKTWSGTAAGWVAAALIGLFVVVVRDWSALAIPGAIALSFASQMGDVAESALKRRFGIKDSSALIPGHGGVMDRCDGMMGAALIFWIFSALMG